ncbi:MAG: 4-alpha-glucanotransferase [Anaerolineae bacterium]|nr:4-alpha-glucanotransferase [Anaerolineae bacterium]
MRFPRSSGILLHPTSFPGRFGIGEIGEEAFHFIDFLVKSGQSLWQILPLGPTGYGDSPYACFSALAGNPMLINLSQLAADGDIVLEVLQQSPEFPAGHVDFGPVISFKMAVLHRAARNFRERATGERKADFERFCAENAAWLEDFALFMALKEAHGGAAWNTWEEGLTLRQPDVLTEWRERLAETVYAYRYFQYQFSRQWNVLKRYANQKGIQIIGDIPIFVAYDSVDVWANPDLFKLDENRTPTVVAGVPPDYFSPTGQLWGNPVYRWDVLAKQGYSWWITRVKHTLRMVDIIRFDHFRGFEAYWEVLAGEPTAINGHWVKGPGLSFFKALEKSLGELPLIAEDLGFITPEVGALRQQMAFPGMKILQFAFAADASNPYLPHNYESDCVVYTGTHDNDTTMGWYEKLGPEERERLHRYLGPLSEAINWALIRLAYQSVAGLAIVPLQDVLGLGSQARMNIPATAGGNWQWRFRKEELLPQYGAQLLEMALVYGRKGPEVKRPMPEYM